MPPTQTTAPNMCRASATAVMSELSIPRDDVLLRFPLYGRCIQVLHLEPVRRAAGTVDGILALRDDAFETKLAGIGEDGRAVALHMLVEPDAGAGLGHDIRERGLADLKRIAPQIVAVQVACFVMPVPCRSRSPFHCGNRRRIRRPPHATNPCSAA